jgi:hypothetical protein
MVVFVQKKITVFVFRLSQCYGLSTHRQVEDLLVGQAQIVLCLSVFKVIMIHFAMIYHKLQVLKVVSVARMVEIAQHLMYAHVHQDGLVLIVRLQSVK